MLESIIPSNWSNNLAWFTSFVSAQNVPQMSLHSVLYFRFIHPYYTQNDCQVLMAKDLSLVNTQKLKQKVYEFVKWVKDSDLCRIYQNWICMTHVSILHSQSIQANTVQNTVFCSKFISQHGNCSSKNLFYIPVLVKTNWQSNDIQMT